MTPIDEHKSLLHTRITKLPFEFEFRIDETVNRSSGGDTNSECFGAHGN